MNLDPEKLTKLEAAARQLRQAIHLFFSNGDLIAVHTLAAASLQVLADLGAMQSLESVVKGNHPWVRPEKRRFVNSRFREAENFFKHADRDSDAVLTFFPAATPFYLIDAVVLYEQLSKTSPPACRAYRAWFSVNYPDLLEDGEYKQQVEGLVASNPELRNAEVAYSLLLMLEEAR